MHRQNIQPEGLAQRVVDGHVLYSHVVVVEGQRMIFVAGQLARDSQGNVVGKGDMRAQLRQVGENITATLAAAGATVNDIVKTTTYVTDIDEFFRHVDVRMEYFGALPTSTPRSRGSGTGRRFLMVRQAKHNTNVSVWTHRSHLAPPYALTCLPREDIQPRSSTSSYVLGR